MNLHVLQLVICVMFFSLTLRKLLFYPFLLAVSGDEDIKIAPGPGAHISDRGAASHTSSDEADAQAYLCQRQLGNTQKAGRLGARMASEIIITDYPQAPDGIEHDRFVLETKLLCAFAVNRALEEHVPNSILGQSALAAFYDAVQDNDSAFYDAIGQSGSFSMYMYLSRSESTSGMAFATTFAQMCGDRNSEGCFEAGLAAYTTAYNHAVSLIQEAQFK